MVERVSATPPDQALFRQHPDEGCQRVFENQQDSATPARGRSDLPLHRGGVRSSRNPGLIAGIPSECTRLNLQTPSSRQPVILAFPYVACVLDCCSPLVLYSFSGRMDRNARIIQEPRCRETPPFRAPDQGRLTIAQGKTALRSPPWVPAPIILSLFSYWFGAFVTRQTNRRKEVYSL